MSYYTYTIWHTIITYDLMDRFKPFSASV